MILNLKRRQQQETRSGVRPLGMEGVQPPAYRPPVGMPVQRERRWPGTIISILVHVLIIALLIVPFLTPATIVEIVRGAGGPGPTGGGGGGRRGSGEPIPDRVKFIYVTPPPPSVVTPPVVPPIVPPPIPPPTPQPAVKAPEAVVPPVPTVGTGGGAGDDGTKGSGPGTGGGVGSGTGTGTGAGVGPGTGGGEGTIYPPQPQFMIVPSWNTPRALKGRQLDVVFDVDSTGHVMAIDFPPTPDRGFNRRLIEQLREYRFRPAVRGDGVPVRARAIINITL